MYLQDAWINTHKHAEKNIYKLFFLSKDSYTESKYYSP